MQVIVVSLRTQVRNVWKEETGRGARLRIDVYKGFYILDRKGNNEMRFGGVTS